MSLSVSYPSRIVCLTEETTETLYLLGEEARIVGISGFTVRPPRARKEKPRVSAFTSAKIDRILELEPDLVLGFSDLQADIAAQLIRAGIAVHVFNQRSVAEIYRMIAVLGGMVGCEARAAALIVELQQGVEAVRSRAASFARRPRVYFEEWDEPRISCIQWVSELIGIAGGDDVFAEAGQVGQQGGFPVAETSLALRGEQFGNRPARATLQFGVGVEERPAEPLGQQPPDRGLPRATVADQEDQRGRVTRSARHQ